MTRQMCSNCGSGGYGLEPLTPADLPDQLGGGRRAGCAAAQFADAVESIHDAVPRRA